MATRTSWGGWESTKPPSEEPVLRDRELVGGASGGDLGGGGGGGCMLPRLVMAPPLPLLVKLDCDMVSNRSLSMPPSLPSLWMAWFRFGL
jgi:hypothetical protein